MLYAEVAVETPVRPRITTRVPLQGEKERGSRVEAFHYLIPAHLEKRIRPGQWVWVPFGSRHLPGVVISLAPEAPEIALREIADIVDDRPVLTETQLSLARWMSEIYLTPLYDCLRLFLPPGGAPRAENVYRFLPGVATGSLTPRQREVAHLLREQGPLTKEEIESLLLEKVAAEGGPKRWQGLSQRTLDSLVRRGILERQSRLVPPRVRPRYREAVRLVLDEREALRVLARSVSRYPVSDALLLLAESQENNDPLIGQERLESETGISANSLKELAKEGLVALTMAVQVVDLAPARERETGSVAGEDAKRLIALLRRGGPRGLDELEAAGFPPEMVEGLVQEGYLEERTLPAWASLAVAVERAWERVIEMANLTGSLQALHVLARRGRVMWLDELMSTAGCTRLAVERLIESGAAQAQMRRFYRDPLIDLSTPRQPLPALTNDQEESFAAIAASLEGNKGDVFLLHGVTGSGKTEVYLAAIERVLAQGRQAVVLVPEIALTPQTLRRFSACFAGQIAVQHSQLTGGERYDQWTLVRDGVADIVIGPRSALFAPLSDCGLIIVDEEHEHSYKQEAKPYYHARAVALHMAELTGCTVVLGSATPDVSTYRMAERGSIHLLRLPERYSREGALGMPPVRVVDMRRELRDGHTGLFSRELIQALQDTLAASEQAILFLNRRGTATFVMCRDCGYVVGCPRCDLPLTYHMGISGDDDSVKGCDGTLHCHHCNHREVTPRQCPECGGARIRYFGAGTERLQSYTESMFPQARVVRWDRDTTRSKGGHEAILERFLRHEADILVGTQMVAKGLDLPQVTLVGVVAADTALFFPDFRAGERTFQLLTQVAGRAGRRERGGRAIVQTYHPDHYAIQTAAHHDYESFYHREIGWRKRLGYPPFGEMIRLLYVHRRWEAAEDAARELGERLRLRIRQLGLPNLEVIGPAPCFYSRLRGRYRWHILLRGFEGRDLLREEPLAAGWRVDVDPVSFL